LVHWQHGPEPQPLHCRLYGKFGSVQALSGHSAGFRQHRPLWARALLGTSATPRPTAASVASLRRNPPRLVV